MKKCLLIVGMHRGGTSSLAGALSKLGVELGSSLMPAREGENERGYFEHLQIYDVHVGLLRKLGYSWDDIRPLPESALLAPAVDPFRGRLREILGGDFGDSPLWGVKDPRLCKLIPFWTDLLERLGRSPAFVVVTRHPQEVAASLRRRDGFSGEKSGLLWLDHLLTAERSTRGRPRVFLAFSDLLADPVRTLRRAGDVLQLDWPRTPQDAATDLAEFLAPSLRHHVASQPPAADDYGRFGPAVCELFELLTETNLSDANAAAEAFDRISERARGARQLLDPLLVEQIGHLNASLDGLADELARVEQDRSLQLSRVHAQLTGLDQRHERLREVGLQGLEEARRQADGLDAISRRLDELDQDREASARALASLDDSRKQLHHSFKQIEQAVDRHSDSIESQTRRQKRLTESVARVEQSLGARAEHLRTLARGHERQRETLRQLEERLEERTRWLQSQAQEINKQKDLLHKLEGLLGERTEWLRVQDREFNRLRAFTQSLAERTAAQSQTVQSQSEHLARVAGRADGAEARLHGHEQAFAALAQRFRHLEPHYAHTTNLLSMLWTSKPWRLYGSLGSLKRAVLGDRAESQATWAFEAPPALELDWSPPRTSDIPTEDGDREAAPERPDPSIVEAEILAAEKRRLLAEILEIGLEFRSTDRPLVSIVIPVFNQVETTLGCLDSIANAVNDAVYEVLVVDDCSTDLTPAVLAEVPGLRLVRNDENVGFLHTCNRGAEEARGRYVLFLNNDTTVSDGWIDRLLQTFDDFEDVGLVGAKLVFPDGRLAEAGGIIWRDGSGHNYGRGEDPSEPRFNYARQVDYCSAACVLIPRELFRELGGFDSRYAPAYYEDVDLAFRVRKAGKHVYYQPAAQVVHLEGVSHGVDVTQGIKRYQVENQARFFQRWKSTLSSHRESGVSPDLEKDRYFERRLLLIDHRMPTPDQDAGSLRICNMMKVFRQLGFKITLIPHNLYPQEPYTRQLQQQGIEVLGSPTISSIRDYLSCHGLLCEYVLIGRYDVAEQHLATVRELCPQATVLFDTVDLHHLRELRQAELEDRSDLLEAAEATQRRELAVASSADATIVTSPAEQEILARQVPPLEAHVVPTIHQPMPLETPFHNRKGLLFVGGFEHPPNVDAVTWFVHEIFPLVREQIADVPLFVVGSKPTEEITALKGEQVFVAGYVEDLEPYFSSCRLSVAPLRYGAGIKGKLTHSLSLGLPCVATSLACEGTYLVDGRDVLMADRPRAFAEAVVRLYRDEELWQKLSARGLDNIRKYFSFEAATRAIEGILSSDARRLEAAARSAATTN